MNLYCVYLTIYSGDKMPQLYIGSSSIKKVLYKNYKGSVSSIKYEKIWKSEIKNNPNKFATFILSTHKCRRAALIHEKNLQEKYNVVKSDLYINMSTANENGFFGMDTSNDLNPNYGGKYSKCIEAINANKKFIGVSWEDRFGSDQANSMKKNLKTKNSGKNNFMFNKVNVFLEGNLITIDKSDYDPSIHKFINEGKQMSEEQKIKLSIINTGKKHTNETKNKMSLVKQGAKNCRARKVSIDGNVFETCLDAAIFYGIAKSTVTYRCNNPKIENWIYL